MISVLICGGAAGPMLGLARAAGVDARVMGTFTVRARVTTAVNVLG